MSTSVKLRSSDETWVKNVKGTIKDHYSIYNETKDVYAPLDSFPKGQPPTVTEAQIGQ